MGLVQLCQLVERLVRRLDSVRLWKGLALNHRTWYRSRDCNCLRAGIALH